MRFTTGVGSCAWPCRAGAICLAVAVLGGLDPRPVSAQRTDALARARMHYNEGQYEDAIKAADEARLAPDLAAGAELIAARAYLERYRESAALDDLQLARERLRQINPH